MNALIVVLAAHIALADAEQLTGKHRKIGTSKPHRFTQAALKGGDNDEKGVMSLLFHGPVTPRHINFGLEDSNRGVVNEIELSEDEAQLENTLNRLQESEQNQLDAVQESLFLQNAQLGQIQRFIAP